MAHADQCHKSNRPSNQKSVISRVRRKHDCVTSHIFSLISNTHLGNILVKILSCVTYTPLRYDNVCIGAKLFIHIVGDV